MGLAWVVLATAVVGQRALGLPASFAACSPRFPAASCPVREEPFTPRQAFRLMESTGGRIESRVSQRACAGYISQPAVFSQHCNLGLSSPQLMSTRSRPQCTCWLDMLPSAVSRCYSTLSPQSNELDGFRHKHRDSGSVLRSVHSVAGSHLKQPNICIGRNMDCETFPL